MTEARVELFSGGTYSASKCPSFTLLMCLGCGHSSWFTDPKRATAMFGSRVERIDVPAGAPFR